MKRERRKQYLVSGKIQIKYALLTVLLLTIYTLMLLTAIFAPYVIAIFSDLPLQQKAEAAEVILLLHGRIWPGIGLIIVLCGIYSTFITHKLAGPIYAIKKAVNKIAKGDLTLRIRLRKGDDLQDLADSINLMTDNTQMLIVKIKEEFKEVSACIDELEKELSAGKRPGTELAQRMKDGEKKIDNLLNEFNYPTAGGRA